MGKLAYVQVAISLRVVDQCNDAGTVLYLLVANTSSPRAIYSFYPPNITF